MEKHRDAKLSEEVYFVVLRLVQMRDNYIRTKNTLKITSVKYHGVELKKVPELAEIDLCKLSAQDAKRIGNIIGFNGCVRGRKNDITINGFDYGIRCMNYTDRPLVNHSDRRKYKAVCQRLGLDISVLDTIVREYWIRRKLHIFNEDCCYYSDLNPFLSNKEYLKELLTFMAFNSFNYNKPPHSDEFISDSINRMLDYVIPWDDSTWRVYFPNDYFDSIWSSLCFSMRGDKGMPVKEKLFLPEYEDIRSWVCEMPGKRGDIQYKGALHIRIKKYDASQKGQVFEDTFKEAITKVKQNQGERDEYLLKLFLIECRQKRLAVPIGNSTQIVESVGSLKHEYGVPTIWMKWNTLSAEDLVFVCNSVKANKAGRYAKADIFVNGIGISVKSERGAAPSLINHTTRDKVLRVMKAINSPILPLDRIIDEYWALRLNGSIGEDVKNSDCNSPFSCKESCFSVLKPLLNYFAFDGTGSRDSVEPTEYILSVQVPDDVQTWTYYTKEDFVDTVWDKLVFSIRSKSTPQIIDENNSCHQQMLPWIKEVEGKLKGALSVRIGG